MKKLILIGMGVSLFAFNWNGLSGMFKTTIDTLDYTIETSGTNPRVYEFDTQGYPKLHCVALFRDSTKTAPAMYCVPTKEQYIKINKKIMDK